MRMRFLVNPAAGKVRPRDLLERIREEFVDFETEIVLTSCAPTERSPRAAGRSGRSRAPGGPAIVVAAGGDGTVHQALSSLAGSDSALGILPLGRANDFARALGIPLDFERACAVLRQGRTAPVDLLQVNGKRFATGGGLGLIAEVSARARRWTSDPDSRLGRFLGPAAYPLAAFLEIAGGWERVGAIVEGPRLTIPAASFAALMVSKQARLGRWFSPSPTATASDGLLHLCSIQSPASRLRMLWISLQILRGRGARCREVTEMRASRIRIRTGWEMPFFADGEEIARGRDFDVRVLPNALRVVIPEDMAPEEARHAG